MDEASTYKHGDMVEAPDGGRWVFHEGLGWTQNMGIPFDKMTLPTPTGPEAAQSAREAAAQTQMRAIKPEGGRKEVDMPVLPAAGEMLKGIPVAGRFMPQTEGMTKFETEHPRRAKAFQMGGGAAATAPLFGLAGGSVLANAALGGGLNAADTAVGGGTMGDVLRSGGVGAAGASILPALAKTPRLITPYPINPERQSIIDYLGSKGVKSLTAGQKTGNEGLKYDESVSKGHIGDEGRVNDKLNREFTSAALGHGGIDATNTLGNTMPKMDKQIGDEFNRLTASTALPFSGNLQNNLLGTVTNYERNVNSAMVQPLPQNIMNEAATLAGQQGGRLTGQQYQTLRSALGRKSASATDPEYAEVLRDMRNHLDDAMESHLAATAPDEVGAFKDVRDKYRHILILEKAATGSGELAGQGYISPAALRTAAKSVIGTREASQGTHDLYNLGRAGEALLKPLPNSGTAQRLGAQEGSSLAMILGGEAIGQHAGVPGVGAAAGAIGAHLARKALQQARAETIMHPAMQRYYANQMAPGSLRTPASVQAMVNELSRARPSQ